MFIREIILLFLYLSLEACSPDIEFAQQDTPRVQERNAVNESEYESLKLVGATRATSALLKGLTQQLRSGDTLDFRIVYHLDDVLNALEDHKVLAALHLSSLNTASSVGSFKLGESELWWATTSSHTRLSRQEWQDLLAGKQKYLDQGVRFQLCLREGPDPLETLWGQTYPKDYELIKAGRSQNRWPTFNDEQSLLEYLSQTPGAIALFVAGNLKLKGAPLNHLKFEALPAPKVKAEFNIRSDFDQTQWPIVFKRLMNTINSEDRTQAVQEWGWQP